MIRVAPAEPGLDFGLLEQQLQTFFSGHRIVFEGRVRFEIQLTVSPSEQIRLVDDTDDFSGFDQ